MEVRQCPPSQLEGLRKQLRPAQRPPLVVGREPLDYGWFLKHNVFVVVPSPFSEPLRQLEQVFVLRDAKRPPRVCQHLRPLLERVPHKRLDYHERRHKEKMLVSVWVTRDRPHHPVPYRVFRFGVE